MSDASPKPLAYSLDHRDRIVGVSDAWTRFALENDAPELARKHVLQRSLWDLLDDPTTARSVPLDRESPSTVVVIELLDGQAPL